MDSSGICHSRSKKLLVARHLTIRNKKLLVAPGIATSNKCIATRSRARFERFVATHVLVW